MALAPDPLCIVLNCPEWAGQGTVLGVRSAGPNMLEGPCEVWFHHGEPPHRGFSTVHDSGHAQFFSLLQLSKTPWEVLQEKEQRMQFRWKKDWKKNCDLEGLRFKE